jgi:hypothetical protein
MPGSKATRLIRREKLQGYWAKNSAVPRYSLPVYLNDVEMAALNWA